ncbi:hypothetical protein DIPPA_34717 [Diplonema papillatum]|nr:hypothetical protein DIPPA_34717 [Diplonema papillatum]
MQTREPMLLFAALVSLVSQASSAVCPTCITLPQVVTHIKTTMPTKETEDWVAPPQQALEMTSKPRRRRCSQAATIAIKAHFDGPGDHTAIQFHGMLGSSCPGVSAFLTNSISVHAQENEKIDLLRDAVTAAIVEDEDGDTPVFTVYGDSPSCGLAGTTNVQGRLFNNVAAGSVCKVSSVGYSGDFIHIEQEKWVRRAGQYDKWVTTINSVDFASAVPPRSVAVTAPPAGPVGLATTVRIQWTSFGVAGNVKLTLDDDGESKSVEKTIALSIADTGSFDWIVPGSVATDATYVIRVRNVEYPAVKSYSEPLTFFNAVKVLTPNGGGQLRAGEEVSVTWTAPGVGLVKVALCKGTTFYKDIVVETENDGHFLWTVPDDVDTSYTGVISPNGGEQLKIGSQVDVRWAAPGVGSVKVSLCKETTFDTDIVVETENDGHFLWTVPASVDTAYVEYTVRVWSVDTTSARDFSDAPVLFFTTPVIALVSPATGALGLATTVTVEWTSTGGPANVQLSLHKDDDLGAEAGIVESTPNNGSFLWLVPGAIATDATYVIRVRGVENTDLTAFSEPLTFFNPVCVVSPNGGEQVYIGEQVNVNWTAPGVGLVKVALCKGTTFYKDIVVETDNDGHFVWTVPASVDTSYEGYTIRVRSVDETSVRDFSDSPIAISLAGFKVVPPSEAAIGLATTVLVEWETFNVEGDVQVSLHENNDVKQHRRDLASSMQNTGSLAWLVRGSTSTDISYVFRVRSKVDTSLYTFSKPATFFNPITVLSPNGGEQLRFGDQVNVNWTAPGVRLVKVALCKGKTFYKDIVVETENDGHFLWTVPDSIDTSYTGYTVRVRSVDEISVNDFSDSPIIISQ